MRERIEEVNQRLKAACVPYRVRLNGTYLVIRGMLPCKPGKGIGRAQQDISPGLPATPAGLKRAEKLCHRLSDEVASGTFLWANWQNPRREKPDRAPETVKDLIERFKSHHLSSSHCKESTWEKTWLETFRQLPQDEPLNEAAILALVLTKAPDTRIRQLTCSRLAKLAIYAGLDIDLGVYEGDYSRGSLQPRKLPSDEMIEQSRLLIPNPDWQWIYGVIATFGLRPHEAFFCEFLDSESLHVHTSKTIEHTAKALRPDWVRDWNLQQVKRPSVTGKTLRDYGQRVRSQLGSRYKLPFKLYDLRHAYAIRGVRLGFNPPEMARWMGHSESVHRDTYRRWLDKETTDRIYRQKIGDGLDFQKP